MRVDLALRVGLSKLLSQRSGVPIRTMVVDEPDGLDTAGMNAFAECLRELAQDFDLILVVSHQEHLAGLLPSVIRVERDATGASWAEITVQ
jgi:DNA repair exonuclease SbcCD ATPase subunit